MSLFLLAVEVLVKTTVIAIGALVLARGLTDSPARDRVLLLRIAVCVLVVSPVMMLSEPVIALPWAPPLDSAPSMAPTGAPVLTLSLEPVAKAVISVRLSETPLHIAAVWLFYATGVLAFAAPFGVGVAVLRRWSDDATIIASGPWAACLGALVPSSGTRLAASDRIHSPLSWGLSPGTILLDPQTLRQPHVAESVLAHEFAHITANDWAFKCVSHTARALFWFNPAVWILHRTLEEASEEAADEAAAALIGRREYAHVLLNLTAAPLPVGGLALAGGTSSLHRRILRLANGVPRRSPEIRTGAAVAAAAVSALTLLIGVTEAVVPNPEDRIRPASLPSGGGNPEPFSLPTLAGAPNSAGSQDPATPSSPRHREDGQVRKQVAQAIGGPGGSPDSGRFNVIQGVADQVRREAQVARQNADASRQQAERHASVRLLQKAV